MKHKSTFILLAIIAVLLIASGFQPSPEYKILFEKAKFTMETKGDLNGAINIFNDIIKKYPKEREYAAKSQLYIGLCYEKLGAKEAQKAYERVLRDYADQAEIVAQARERLAALGDHGGAKGLVTRRILTDASGIGEVLTADGKYISHIDRGTGDMVQFEVASGQMSRITNKGGAAAKEAPYEYQAFSHDGKQIAYDSYGGADIALLRIRNLDGSGLRTLYSEKGYDTHPLDWSPDARSILVYRGLTKGSDLTLISTADGSVRVLKNIPSEWVDARFSPDGQFIAISFAGEGSTTNGDIFLMTADGLNEIAVTAHPAEDKLLQWTPDGKNLLFLSDRSGTWDIWTVRITGGKPQGEPELLKKDFGYDSEILGFAPDGSLYYKTHTSIGRLYSGAVNSESGRLLVSPEQVSTRYTSPAQQLKWSPDGSKLAYISNMGRVGPGHNILTIRSAATGEERFLKPRLRGINQIFWTADSHFIIALGWTETGTGTYRIDTETSEANRLTDGCVFPFLCPDGKTLIHWNGGMIRKRNLDTGEESDIIKTTSVYPACLDLSSNGREVVFQTDVSIMTISLDGGEPREFYKKSSAKPYQVKWTSDGHNIIALPCCSENSEIWRIPTQGGSPLKFDLSIAKMSFFALHPDNSRFAFSIYDGFKVELWVMENFLPK